MMASPAVVTVRVSLRWWVVPYLYTLALLCATLRTKPDPEKVAYWVCRGIRITAGS